MLRTILRVLAIALLAFGCLFYLQFGLQAWVHHVPQGVLALVGALALGWGTVQMVRRRPAAGIVFLGTVPMLLLHAWMTIEDPGELPFVIGSIPAPALAAVVWLWRRKDGQSPSGGSAEPRERSEADR